VYLVKISASKSRLLQENLLKLKTRKVSKNSETVIFEKGIGRKKEQFGKSVKHLLDAKELGFLLGLSVWTIRKWKDQEKIPFVRLGRAIRYNFEDVISSLNKGS